MGRSDLLNIPSIAGIVTDNCNLTIRYKVCSLPAS
jgi:hypothetical protein